jgi:hypothetical protein
MSDARVTDDDRKADERWRERLYRRHVLRNYEVLDAARSYHPGAGRCPSCNAESLFLASGGHVTCNRSDCPDPCAADRVLHADAATGQACLSCGCELRENGHDGAMCRTIQLLRREHGEMRAALRNVTRAIVELRAEVEHDAISVLADIAHREELAKAGTA